MITPSRTELENKVHDYIVAATGLPNNRVTVAEQSRPAPTDPFCSFKFLPDVRVGIDESRFRDVADPSLNSEHTITGTRIAFFSIQFFRAGAYDFARRLLNFHQTTEGRFFLRREKLVFGSVSDVRALDQIVSDRWEEHAGLDLELYFAEVRTEEVGTIGTVSIIIKESDSTDYTETLEVTE